MLTGCLRPMFGWPFVWWSRRSRFNFSRAASGPAAWATVTALPSPAINLSPTVNTCHQLPRTVSFGSIRERLDGQVTRRDPDAARAYRSSVTWCRPGVRVTNGEAKAPAWCLSNRCSRKTLGGNEGDGNDLLQVDDDRWCARRMGDDTVDRHVSNGSTWDRRHAMDGGLKGLWGLSPSATSRWLRNTRGKARPGLKTVMQKLKCKMQKYK